MSFADLRSHDLNFISYKEENRLNLKKKEKC